MWAFHHLLEMRTCHNLKDENLKDLPQSYVTRLGNRVRILFTGLAKALERYELDEIDKDYI